MQVLKISQAIEKVVAGIWGVKDVIVVWAHSLNKRQDAWYTRRGSRTHVEDGKFGNDTAKLLVKGVLGKLDLAHVDWTSVLFGLLWLGQSI